MELQTGESIIENIGGQYRKAWQFDGFYIYTLSPKNDFPPFLDMAAKNWAVALPKPVTEHVEVSALSFINPPASLE